MQTNVNKEQECTVSWIMIVMSYTITIFIQEIPNLKPYNKKKGAMTESAIIISCQDDERKKRKRCIDQHFQWSIRKEMSRWS